VNGYLLIISVVYIVGQGGTASGPAVNYTAAFADFPACAKAADTARKQIYADMFQNGNRPRIHAVCLPQSSH
jgi:hypothetical protein